MSIKRKDLKVDEKYTLNDLNNIFKVLAIYEEYHWILWIDNGDVESVYFNESELNKMNIFAT